MRRTRLSIIFRDKKQKLENTIAMNDFENSISKFNSSKLLKILDSQGRSYSAEQISCITDELIRRDEKFSFNKDFEEEIVAMSSLDLALIVEKQWNRYHLEYLEIARIEYVRRGLEHKTIGDQGKTIRPSHRHRLLNVFIIIYWICIAMYSFTILITMLDAISNSRTEPLGFVLLISTSVYPVLLLAMIPFALRVFINIEENMRLR